MCARFGSLAVIARSLSDVRTSIECSGMSALCRFCCRSRRLWVLSDWTSRFELITCDPLILAVLNYAGLREAGLRRGWWSDDKFSKPAEILRDCRQRELELCTSRTA